MSARTTKASATRRDFLQKAAGGFGGLALSAMLQEGSQAATPIHDLQQRKPMHAPRAKAVIQLFMHGGPSQMDLLDPKPMLNKYHGKTPPDSVVDDENRTKYPPRSHSGCLGMAA